MGGTNVEIDGGVITSRRRLLASRDRLVGIDGNGSGSSWPGVRSSTSFSARSSRTSSDMVSRLLRPLRFQSEYIADCVGCEGAESMLPALDTLFEVSAKGESSHPPTHVDLKCAEPVGSWYLRRGPLTPSPWSTIPLMRSRPDGLFTYRPILQDQR